MKILRRIQVLLSCLIFIHCSQQKNQDEASQLDTTSLPPSEITDVTTPVFEEVAMEGEGDSLKFVIDNGIEDIASICRDRSVHTLSGSFSGYESSADATYYFDSLFSLTYCTVTWGSEGSSGNYSYYFRNDSLIAGKEENYYNDSEEFIYVYTRSAPVFGYSKSNSSESEESVAYLSQKDYSSKNADAANELNRLIGRISEYQDSVSVSGKLVTLRIENTVNYGEDFTETENFDMSQEIFDNLIRN
jgi:hypothetical protein